MIAEIDPLDGQEVQMLNTMLAVVYPLARDGDGESIDRVIKILTLKRRYRADRDASAYKREGTWD